MKTTAATVAARAGAFYPVTRCWVCGGDRLQRIHQCLFELSIYRTQDPELAAYTGARLWIVRCHACGFGQPEALPSLPRFFERMYDQRWSDEWIAAEFASGAKRRIFDGVLDALERRLPSERRTLVDVGAHVGRLLQMAGARGWRAEGIELNPRTAESAARRTGVTVHQLDARRLAAAGRAYDAITLIDVLEHIPEPVAMLRTAASLLAAGGWAAIKVPSGPNQLRKERVRAAMGRASRVSVADNLVHVNHFSPRSLRLALEAAGFADVTIHPGAPELPDGAGAAALVQRATSLAARWAARLTGGARSPLAFNLQSFARKPGKA